MKTNRSNVIIIMNCIVISPPSNNENKLFTKNRRQSTLHRWWYIQAVSNPLNKQRCEVCLVLYRYNDLSFITGRDHLNKLRKEPLVEADLAVGSAHNNLMDMRKKYDDMKKQCLNKETTIFQLKVILCQFVGREIKVWA